MVEQVDADEDFKRVMDLLESGHFNRFEAGVMDSITQAIREPADLWMTAADFRAFEWLPRLSETSSEM